MNSTSLMPSGIMTPASDGSGAINGVYPGAFPDDPNCCWLGPSAMFSVRAAANVQLLIVTLFLPDLVPYHAHAQNVKVSVDGGKAQLFAHLPMGTSILRVAVKAHRETGVHSVALRMGYDFSPKDEGLNGDTRRLSIYLKSVQPR